MTFDSTASGAPDRQDGVDDVTKRLTVIIVLVLVLVAIQISQAVMGMSVKSQRWEYTIEAPSDAEFQSTLRTLGNEGWEIVSARRATSEENGKTAGLYELILRRPAVALGNALPVPPNP